MPGHFDTANDYIASQPGEVKEILRKLRRRALAERERRRGGY
ncbi:hypothetical protein [Arthrobacter bambusae]|nr:hypothetical protein [Arthrobacter bambusae]MDQ0031897.1 hypothetical protein [Arthrobacter bambusae]MDQ0100074.1 hypothetical protein [Arthrobacter bambusae]